MANYAQFEIWRAHPTPRFREVSLCFSDEIVFWAEFYARRAGMTLGRMVSISDAGTSGRGAGPTLGFVATATKAASPVAAGELSVIANLTVVFELVE